MKNIFTVSSKNFLIDKNQHYCKYRSISRLLLLFNEHHSLISTSKKCIYHTISGSRYIRPMYMSCGRFHTIYSLNVVHQVQQNKVYSRSIHDCHREDEWNCHR